MNILHLRDSGGIFGAERILLSIISNLDRKNFMSYVVCMHSMGDEGKDLMQAIEHLGFEAQVLRMHGRFDLGAVISLRRIISQNQIDVIHCHDFKSNFYGLLSTLGTSVRRVTTSHGSTLNGMLKYYSLIDTYFTLRFYHKVITVSEKLTEYYHKRGFQKNKITEVINGIDTSYYLAKIQEMKNSPEISELQLPEKRLVLGTIGRLFPEKGIDFLVKSFQRLRNEFPNLYLLVVGDGPERKNLEKLVDSLNLGVHVLFTGVLNNVIPALQQMDIFVMPSLREGFPNVILEAAFFEKRIVTTNVGSIPLLIQEGKTGILVRPASVESLTQGIKRCLLQETETRTMAVLARKKLEKDFTSKQMVRKIENVYLKLYEKQNEI
jgi:glycosyltransferase involved in cell wall biosynthesis